MKARHLTHVLCFPPERDVELTALDSLAQSTMVHTLFWSPTLPIVQLKKVL